VAQSKALEFLQMTVMNVIFPRGEFAANLIIAKMPTSKLETGNSSLPRQIQIQVLSLFSSIFRSTFTHNLLLLSALPVVRILI